MIIYKIRQRINPNAVYASGFYTIERALAWLDKYDPQMWTDKTITCDDLEIAEEEPFKRWR